MNKGKHYSRCARCGTQSPAIKQIIQGYVALQCTKCECWDVVITHTRDKDMVNSLEIQHGGTHYKTLQIQPVEYCQKNNLNFCESSAIKYITRHKDKGQAEDIKKAIHFLQMLLDMEYGIQCDVKYPISPPVFDDLLCVDGQQKEIK